MHERRQSPRTRWCSRVPFTCRRCCNQVTVSGVARARRAKMRKKISKVRGKIRKNDQSLRENEESGTPAHPGLWGWLRPWWLCQFMSTCYERCKIHKMWRKATVIALPKTSKPKDDPKSYRSNSPLCIPFKLLERMIHGRINTIIDPQLPHEQDGIRKGRSTVDRVTLLTQDIQDCFEAKETAGAILVDLTAVYDTVWHRG